MAKASDNEFPKVIIIEQASPPDTPASGTQKLFLDSADGHLKRVDESDTVVDLEEIAGSGYEEGTSFPVSPSTNDKFYRTDRNLLYFYDGTRWLTTTLYEHNLMIAGGVAASTGYYSAVWTADYDVYVVDFIGTMFAASGLSGTAYWRLDLFFWDGATQGSAIASVNNQSGTNATFVRKKVSVNALMGTAKDAIGCVAEKVSTPGNFSGGAFLTYRLVG